jgi:putative membrane protein insertion efficiency factor
MKKIGLFLIKIYQKILRELLVSLGIASDCCFTPTCSDYTKEAFEKYGHIKGFLLGLKRISKCGFCKKHHYDPLP